MTEAFLHRFKWEGQDKVTKELRHTDPRELETPRKETVETIKLTPEGEEE